jgi:hypothetical protein
VGNAQRLAEAAKLGLDATLTANARQVLEGAPVLAARGARPTAATARTFCTRCEALGCGAPDCVRLCLSCARQRARRHVVHEDLRAVSSCYVCMVDPRNMDPRNM